MLFSLHYVIVFVYTSLKWMGIQTLYILKLKGKQYNEFAWFVCKSTYPTCIANIDNAPFTQPIFFVLTIQFRM